MRLMEEYIFDFKQVINKFEEIDKTINRKLNIYLIGGAVLLYAKLKSGTKDIDLVVNNKKDYDLLTTVLKKSNFLIEKPTKEYSRFNLENILVKDNYRIDIFNKIVCKNLFLSKNMIKRAKLVKAYNNIQLYVCSNEDILVFKTITDRDGDIDDCYNLSLQNLNWDTILSEIKYQVTKSGNEIWVTWFEERLNLLEDRKIYIPIIIEIRKLSHTYYTKLEAKLKEE